MVNLDLGCGQNRKDGFIGVDKVKLATVDVVHDLDVYPYPWDDESVDEIFACHFIEHVGDLIKFMDECCRILKKGAKMTVIAPYYTSMGAWQDPTHKRAISESTFFYYNKGWRDANKLDHYGIKCDFDFVFGHSFGPEWVTRHEEARNFALMHYFNVASDIQVVLTKR